ncbi:hypothetical protein OsI_19022 [Oryza sativa Indica Group]|uniref:B1159F04.7 protein n=2 Tax=Oryza sativa TaxID=4530 RepID=Q6MWJ3_ORYSJ|nr:hypothetical protein OsI_19022 [Oryza sativa Indica Group]CAE75944.1 B1159F04.7 [Oryza sativa Japonica Group]
MPRERPGKEDGGGSMRQRRRRGGGGEQIQCLLLPLHRWWQQRRGMVALRRLRRCSGGWGCSGEADPASTGLGRADPTPPCLGSDAGNRVAVAAAALRVSDAGEGAAGSRSDASSSLSTGGGSKEEGWQLCAGDDSARDDGGAQERRIRHGRASGGWI